MKTTKMQDALALAKRCAEKGSAPVTLLGPTGSGKTRLAAQVYGWTGRKGAFVVVDCATIPKELMESQLFGHMKGAFTGATSNAAGAFKQADGGVVFLDEVGEMSLDMQVKLLRVVQEKRFRPVGGVSDVTVDVRIVAATNKNLKAEVEAGRFREDLYYRLCVVPIVIPPLCERRDEIKGLIEDHLAANRWELGDGVAEVLWFAPWPGNVRELLGCVERAVMEDWDADRAREVLYPPHKLTPTGRAGRLAKAMELEGWWSAAELTLATGASKATVCRDLVEWVEAGVLEARGEGSARRYIVSSQSSHEVIETETRGDGIKVGGEP
jgi:transcriptional regulator with GAF, ATPase, and Fis domain